MKGKDDNTVVLLPHNEEGYEKLVDCLKSNQMAAINHATGTGKSFIVLKYLYEHRDKRILYLSPSYPINDQLIEEHMKELEIDYNSFKKFNTEIYANLLGKDMKKIAEEYDVIVIDEYHRCGAPEWGRQINKLLGYIKENKPNTKVIGTTATEIRYLDDEKNMNNILFDGVCASTLTLSDAILRGILPPPVYVNTFFDVYFEIKRFEDKIKRKCFYKEELSKYLNIINTARDEIEKIIKEEEPIENYLTEKGKILVFSSTIDNIEKDKVKVRELLNRDIKEFVVHSGIKKERNKEILNEFRYYNKGLDSVLYSVNILNEGVHVKDVDTIIMLRATTSPRIFFQQLGRLLSYSRRKDRVVVIDSVNNLKRSPYIYKLYIEVVDRAKELIKTDPENRERYENILKRFKIVDLNSRLYEKLEDLKKITSIESININRLDIAIDILEGKMEVSDIEKLQANLDIFKYKKYITLNHFKRIEKLDIDKPQIFSLTYDDFEKYLDGSNNIYQRDFVNINKYYSKIKRFYSDNGCLPSIFSDNDEERDMSCYFIKNINRFPHSVERFLSLVEDTKMSLYEKIIYKKEKNINLNELYTQLDIVLGMDLIIPTSIIVILQNEKNLLADNYLVKIHKHNLELTKKDTEERKFVDILENDKIIDQLMLRQSFEIITKECIAELEQVKNIEEYLSNLKEDIKFFVKQTQSLPTFNSSLTDSDEAQYERRLFCKQIIFNNQLKELGFADEIQRTYEGEQLKRLELRKKMILDELIDFIIVHDGDFPSVKIGDHKEKELAIKFSRIKSILNEEDREFINLYLDKYSDRHKEVVERYIKFIKNNKRYPLVTSDNEYELQLIDDYTRNEQFLTAEEKTLINDTYKGINKKQAMRNSYLELLKAREEAKKLKK